MDDLLKMSIGAFLGAISAVFVFALLDAPYNDADHVLRNEVYQPEYNHRVDIVTATLVSDTNRSEMYAIWFKDQLFIPDTLH